MEVFSEMSTELNVCIVRVESGDIVRDHIPDLIRELRHVLSGSSRVLIDLSDVHAMCTQAVAALLELLRIDLTQRGPGIRHAFIAPPAAVTRLISLVAPSVVAVFDFTEHALEQIRLEALVSQGCSRARNGFITTTY